MRETIFFHRVERYLFAVSASFLWLLSDCCSVSSQKAFAQVASQADSTTTARANPTQDVAEDGRSVPQGRPGAQSIADFTELMALIRSTIDGQWDSGEDKLEPFISGVWIDPTGKLHREAVTSDSKKSDSTRVNTSSSDKKPRDESDSTEVPMLHDVGLDRDDALRWISIHQIEELLTKSHAGPSVRLKLLGGISRIDYVARDPKTKEWFLGGPAGAIVLDDRGDLVSRANGLPPVLLEDLLCVAPLILRAKIPMGCSIDPVPEALQKLSREIKQASFREQLRSKPEKATEFLTETLGDQKATFFGLANDSPTAMALLVADEHMKRLGMGMVQARPGPRNSRLVNYWEACKESKSIPAESMVRWWFALPAKVSIGVDDSGDVFMIKSPTVRVLSQKQFLDEHGDRQDTVEKDAAADAFAESFSKNFGSLQKQFATYGRLRHVFDLAVAMQIIAEETPSRDERPLAIASDDEFRPRVRFPIQWVPSIAGWRKTGTGRVAAVVSGGVMIDITKTSLDRTRNLGGVSGVIRKQATSLE
jgi:hypothetical protein